MFMNILPAGQRITKAPHAVVPALLSLLKGGASATDSPDIDAPGKVLIASPVSMSALACLARLACCNDSERKNALRDALADDQTWEDIALALVSVLMARPLRLQAAAESALVLWAAFDNEMAKKERLIMKHKVWDHGGGQGVSKLKTGPPIVQADSGWLGDNDKLPV